MNMTGAFNRLCKLLIEFYFNTFAVFRRESRVWMIRACKKILFIHWFTPIHEKYLILLLTRRFHFHWFPWGGDVNSSSRHHALWVETTLFEWTPRFSSGHHSLWVSQYYLTIPINCTNKTLNHHIIHLRVLSLA